MSVCFMCVQMSVSAHVHECVRQRCQLSFSLHLIFWRQGFSLSVQLLETSCTVFAPTEDEASRKARHIYTFTGM